MNFIKKSLLDFGNVVRVGVYLYVPFLFLVVFGKFFINDSYNYLREVVAFGLQTSIYFVLISLAIKSVQFFRKIYFFFAMFLSFFLLVKLSFYSLYGAKLDASSLYVIFETNATEVYEFLQDFLSIQIIILIFFLGIYIFWVRQVIFNKNTLYQLYSSLSVLFFKSVFLKIGILLLLVLSSYTTAEIITYEIYHTLTHKLIASGIKQYTKKDIIEHPYQRNGQEINEKLLELEQGYKIGARIFKEEKLTGFGLVAELKLSDFSWEWYNITDNLLFKKLQGGTLVSVGIGGGPIYQILEEVNFLDDTELEFTTGCKNKKTSYTILIKQGSVLKFN